MLLTKIHLSIVLVFVSVLIVSLIIGNSESARCTCKQLVHELKKNKLRAESTCTALNDIKFMNNLTKELFLSAISRKADSRQIVLHVLEILMNRAHHSNSPLFHLLSSK